MATTRRRLLGASLALGTLPLIRRAHGQAAHRLTVLHMNDFHSRHEAVDARALNCGPDRAGCFGGSARLATAIARQRTAAEADGRTVLLLDGGDQFQGSLFYTAHHGMAELAVQHAIGTDAMAVGNHEFDNGPAVLGRYAAAARFPVLSANLDVSAEPLLAGRIRPHAVLERAGLRVGLVGLTTLEARISSSPGPNVRFLDPDAALEAAVAALRAGGVHLVIALSHLGVGHDRALRQPGVTAVVGGHTHTLLSNTEPEAAFTHPTAAPSGALVVQAGAYGRFLGRLDLDLGGDGTVLGHGGDCVHVGLDLPPDPAVAAIIAGFAVPLEAELRRPVAMLPAPVGVELCRVAPCAFGALVADTLLHAAHGAEVAVMNAGGLRTGLPAGTVTAGDVLRALPFSNSLATLTLTGADLRVALEHGLSLAGRGGFPQWAGLRMRPGTAGLVIETRERDGSWAPLDPDRRYLVATNSFLRSGGDGYSVFRDRAIDPYDEGTAVSELVTEALAAAAINPP